MNRRNLPSLPSLILLFILGFPFLFLAIPQPARAQGLVVPSETTLNFHGLVGETLQRTFTLTVVGDPVQDLTLVPQDLVDETNGAVILGDQITINPTSLTKVEKQQRIAVTVAGGQKAGHFTGNLEIQYTGQPTGTLLAVTLDVVLEPVPAVDADASSKNLTLTVLPSWTDLPSWIIPPSVPAKSPTLGEVVITLIQDAESDAVVTAAGVSAMQGTGGSTLPENAVRIGTTYPQTILAKSKSTLQVLASGHNLKAGEYSGTVIVNVKNQKATVQVPLKVQVKDGPLLPLLLLAIGPIVGVLINWWNSGGSRLNGLRQRLDRLQAAVRLGKLLQKQDQDQAMQQLEEAINAALAGGSADDITKQIETIEQNLKDATTQARTFLQAKLDPENNASVKEIAALDPGKTVRERLLATLETIRTRVTNGEFHSLASAQQALDAVLAEAGLLKSAIQKFNALALEEQDAKRPLIDQAATVAEIEAQLAAQTKGPAGEEFITGAYRATSSLLPPPLQTEWTLYKIGIVWRRIAVTLIVYLFALAVGWTTLYAAAPTFGSKTEDYLTLFLWGVASNMVGGQTISLKSIFEKKDGSS